MLLNLPKRGTISITSKKKMKEENSDSQQEEEEAVIAIEDTGTGISPEILPRLFSKFATESHTGALDWDYLYQKAL